MPNTPIKSDETKTETKPQTQPKKKSQIKSRFYQLLLVLFVFVLVVMALLAYAVTSDKGTEYVLDTVNKVSSIELENSKGNLFRGLTVEKITIPLSKNKKSNLYVDNAVLKIGWKSIFNNEVAHLRSFQADKIYIEDNNPPENKPFEYKKITLPFELRIDNVDVKAFSFNKITRKPIQLNHITAKRLGWQDETLSLKKATIEYKNFAHIKQLNGTMQFDHNYPVDITAELTVPVISKQKFSTFDVKLGGALENLTGKVTGKWHDEPVNADVSLQPVQKRSPYQALVHIDKMQLPVAQTQQIQLSDGAVAVNGNSDNLVLALNSQMQGKLIPKGRYQALAYLPMNQKMVAQTNKLLPPHNITTKALQHLSITDLKYQSQTASFKSKGILSWHDGIALQMIGDTQQLDITEYVPKSAQKYLPQALTGVFDFTYQKQKDSMAQPKIALALTQDNADKLNARINLATVTKPMTIKGDFVNVSNDELPKGTYIVDMNMSTNATNHKGNYKIGNSNSNKRSANIRTDNSRTIVFDELKYRGSAGKLDATAKLQMLANQQLKWHAEVKDIDLKFAQVKQLKTLPVHSLTGASIASGITIKDTHTINFVDTGLQAVMRDAKQSKTQNSPEKQLSNKSNSRVKVSGGGDIKLQLADNKIQNLHIKHDGSVITHNFPKGISDLNTKGNSDVQLAFSDNKLATFRAKYAGNIATEKLPKGTTQLQVSGTPKDFTIERLVHSGDAGDVDLAGKVSLKNGIHWDIAGKLKQFNPALIQPKMVGSLSGEFDTYGDWLASRKHVQIKSLDISGDLKGYPFLANGKLDINFRLPKNMQDLRDIQQSVQAFDADKLKIQWKDNYLVANGDNQGLKVALNAPSLSQLHASLQGNAFGNVIVTGLQENKPNIQIDMTVNDLDIADKKVKRAVIQGNIVDLTNSASNLTMNLQDLQLGNDKQKHIKAMTVKASGQKSNHTISTSITHDFGKFRANISGRLLNKSRWQGILSQGNIQTDKMNLLQQQASNIALDFDKQIYQASKHCWLPQQNTNAKLCLTEDLLISKNSGEVDVEVENIDSKVLKVFMPHTVLWNGAINGRARTGWETGKEREIEALFYTDDGKIGFATQDPQDDDITVDYNRLSMFVKTQKKGLQVRLDAETPATGSGYIDIVIDPKSADKTINGAMVLDDVRLQVLQAFLPQVREIKGTASLAGGMSGPLKSPQFFGNFKLADASLSVMHLPIYLENISFDSAIRGKQASIKGSFKTGKGTGNVDGIVDWSKDTFANLSVQGKKIEIRKAPTLFAQVTPNIKLNVGLAKKTMDVQGNVMINKARITPKVDNSNVVVKSEDVLVYDRRNQNDNSDLSDKQKAELAKMVKVSKKWDIDTDVKVALAQNNVEFIGFGARVPLTGGIAIKKSNKQSLQGFGQVQIAKRVPIQVYGQSLELTQGAVRFDGNITTPTLNISSEKKISGNVVGVKVTGTPNQPVIEVFNDAGLNEQQAINALITGRMNSDAPAASVAGFENSVNNTLAAAGLSLGLQQTHELTNKIGRGFGLSGLVVDAAGTDTDAQVNITGYITPDLYLRYGVGVFTSVNELTLRYQLSRRVYIEATSALEKAIDLFYNWRF